MEELKPKQVRVYLNKAMDQDFQELCRRIGSLSESAVLTALVEASLRACVEAGYRMPLPLSFSITTEAPEPKPAKPLLQRR